MSSFETQLLVSQSPGKSQVPVVAERSHLRKRQMVPRWWCAALLRKLRGAQKTSLLQEADPEVARCSTQKKSDLRGISLTASCPNKLVPLVVGVWNEIVHSVFRGEGSRQSLMIPLLPLVRGTSHEIMGQFEFLEGHWSAPLHAKLATEGRKSEKSFAFNPVKLARVEGGENPCLNLQFTISLEDLVLGRFGSLAGMADLDFPDQACLSLSPDVIRSLGNTVQPRKMSFYLQLELQKQALSCEKGWQVNSGSGPNSVVHFKETKQLAKQLYDHGTLGWERVPPNRRVKSIGQGSAPLLCWKLSAQSQEALKWENLWSIRLGALEGSPPRNALASVHPLRPEIKNQNKFAKTVVSPEFEVLGSKVQKSQDLEVRQLQSSSEKVEVDAWDRKVVEYYLCLNDVQKAQFCEYKESLSSEEFRRQFSKVVPL